ncbi:MAG: amino-acid N-acetyltransferase [Candidatus Nanopelagicales bacterium]
MTIRPARTADVRAIRALIDHYSGRRILLSKATVTLYEDVPDFLVAVDEAGAVRGCGAIHVLWEDLGELRTLAVDPAATGQGIGQALVRALLARAGDLGLSRVFCLTFQVGFFTAAGFVAIQGAPVSPEVYGQLLQSYDEGVAEFLDLDRVKPNTLGNTRMLCYLAGSPASLSSTETPAP